jgi:hypothetical protein
MIACTEPRLALVARGRDGEGRGMRKVGTV